MNAFILPIKIITEIKYDQQKDPILYLASVSSNKSVLKSFIFLMYSVMGIDVEPPFDFGIILRLGSKCFGFKKSKIFQNHSKVTPNFLGPIFKLFWIL